MYVQKFIKKTALFDFLKTTTTTTQKTARQRAFVLICAALVISPGS